jgi:signal peptidase I
MEKLMPFPRGQPKRLLRTIKQKIRSRSAAVAQPPKEEPDTQSLRRENKEGQTETDLSPQGEETDESVPADPPWEPVARVGAKLLLVVGIVWLVFSQLFALKQITGNYMYPSVRDGDLLLAYRLESTYSQSDVVIYEASGYSHVGRVVAQGGDVVDVTEDGSLKVNGNVESEEGIFVATEALEGGIQFPFTVPEGSYFILCDNRSNFSDSRFFGAVSQDDVVGKMITILRRRGI